VPDLLARLEGVPAAVTEQLASVKVRAPPRRLARSGDAAPRCT
jgi:hypothetical protein